MGFSGNMYIQGTQVGGTANISESNSVSILKLVILSLPPKIRYHQLSALELTD